MKKILIIMITMLLMQTSCSVFKSGLIDKINSTDNEELAKLTFLELNILKNSIFALQGYKFANDRAWLHYYFYDDTIERHSTDTWDMDDYKFIKPFEAKKFQLTKDMQKAIANVRVALYKKIRRYNNAMEIANDIERELSKKHREFVVFGRGMFKPDSNYGPSTIKDSLTREATGYKRIINIIDTNSNFDSCELLGVYTGSVVLLKNIIEAKNGKEFRGVLGWEISQLVGITPKNKKYKFKNLPEVEKEKIIRLIMVQKRLQSSGIGDIPEELQTEGITVETKERTLEELEQDNYEDTYDGEGDENSSSYIAAC